jgi:hypothetical protein
MTDDGSKDAIFEVVRTDDNGCEYVVARWLTPKEATALVDLLTSRGHKQFYHFREISDAVGVSIPLG